MNPEGSEEGGSFLLGFPSFLPIQLTLSCLLFLTRMTLSLLPALKSQCTSFMGPCYTETFWMLSKI